MSGEATLAQQRRSFIGILASLKQMEIAPLQRHQWRQRRGSEAGQAAVREHVTGHLKISVCQTIATRAAAAAGGRQRRRTPRIGPFPHLPSGGCRLYCRPRPTAPAHRNTSRGLNSRLTTMNVDLRSV
ncbi:hypothetical protein E2C01_051076 [Portunus trituberculatus]|uniref:Uncharacterized protein n=1 Tax=Portunus trituberculatus TaxID=210409 RepID=A0A5B7GDT4_PORTR|nr:hypothetical protein [Portunus trituberculatus]